MKKNYTLHEVWKSEFFGLPWMFGSARVVRLAFGNEGKLPSEAGARFLVSDDGEIAVTINLDAPYPKEEINYGHYIKYPNKARHRAWIKCPQCKAKVWCGRINQHRCK